MSGPGKGAKVRADARARRVRLIAAAADHALFAAAICTGKVRFEPFTTAPRGELIVGGLRRAVPLDEFGCPALTADLRKTLAAVTALAAVTGASP